jgi:peptidoglycan/LPS O-acetylase OafA/YrhL
MTIGYRKEIDGLRALAVVPVILFHAGFQLFSGGYVGVDIFFVISGFLITSILLDEHQNQTFSLAAFYERRARRILPALVLVLVCCLPFAYLWLSPLDLRDFAKNVFGANLFLANVVSYQQTNYFDAASEIKPLLHLWSLSIEEQYYLVLPLLLAFLVKRGAYAVFATLFALGIASLIYSEHALYTNERGAFFFTTSRAWELLVGSLSAALIHYKFISLQPSADTRTMVLRQILSTLGICMVLVPILFYSKDTPFPGLFALIPAIGTALILLFALENTWVQRILSLPPLVGIGLISYSAYLWHQPVFAFVRYNSLENLSSGTLLTLIALVMVLAYLSWRFVERPFRNKQQFSRRQILIFATIATSILLVLSFVIYKKNGLPKRFDGKYSTAFFPHEFKEDGFCKFKSLYGSERFQGCEFGDANGQRTVFLVGDSHASSLLGGLHSAFRQSGIKGIRVKVLQCGHQIPGMISASVTAEKIAFANDCVKTYEELSSLVLKHADAVVLSVRWTARFTPIPGVAEEFFFDNQEGGVEFKPNISNFAQDENGQWTVNESAKRRALHNLLGGLASPGKPMVLVYPVPEVGWDLPRYNFTTYRKTGQVQSEVSTSYELFKKRNSFVNHSLDEFNAPNLWRVKPEKYFCNTYSPNRCVAQHNYIPFYHDTNHLSLEGAEPLTDEITKLLMK